MYHGMNHLCGSWMHVGHKCIYHGMHIRGKRKKQMLRGDGERQWKMCYDVFEKEKRIMMVLNMKN